ncbi:MAG TPA: serine hydrolase domain-containing protein, partial [Pyrinomonadaceae bacterium]
MNISHIYGLARVAPANYLSNSMPPQTSPEQTSLVTLSPARRLVACMLLFVFAAQASGGRLPDSVPAGVGMSQERLARIDTAVEEAIARKETPGAVVLAARRGRVVWRKAYGARAVAPQRETMTTDTIFDAASLTKVVATATSIMILVERGQVRLTDPLSR